MKKPNNSKERSDKRAVEAKQIVEALKPNIGGFSLKESAFILSIDAKLQKRELPYVSGKQLAWLRGLELRSGV